MRSRSTGSLMRVPDLADLGQRWLGRLSGRNGFPIVGISIPGVWVPGIARHLRGSHMPPSLGAYSVNVDLEQPLKSRRPEEAWVGERDHSLTAETPFARARVQPQSAQGPLWVLTVRRVPSASSIARPSMWSWHPPARG